MANKPLAKLISALLVYGVLVLTVGAGYVWLILGLKSLGAEVRDAKLKISSLGEERKVVRKVALLLESRTADVERIKNFFVNRENVVDFIESLESLARETGNNLTLDFDEAKSAEADFFFRLTIAGAKDNVLKYLKALEYYPAEIKILDIVFEQANPGGGAAFSALSGAPKTIPATHRLIINIAVKQAF